MLDLDATDDLIHGNQEPGSSTATMAATAPCRSMCSVAAICWPRSCGACPLHRSPTTPASPTAVRSSAHRSQRPQSPAQRLLTYRRIAPNSPAARQLDLDRAFRLAVGATGNLQELQTLSTSQTTLGLPPPMMQQVRMQIVPPRYRPHHRARPSPDISRRLGASEHGL